MLKKLRFKFVLYCMTIVTLMLAVIFFLLYFTTSRNLVYENTQRMEHVVDSPPELSRPNAPPDDVRKPYFSVRIKDDGEFDDVQGNFFDLTDSSSLGEVVSAAQSSGKDEGYLETYNLRFKTFNTPGGEYLVFMDTTNETNMMKSLVKTFIIVGGFAFLLFLGLSILMAHWAVKPVEEAWTQQKQFVADASHELKTPLTVIMTNAELLGGSECSESDRKQFSGNILTMSKQMRGLVESLLDLARLDAGTKMAVHQSMSLSDAVSSAAMSFEPVFFERGLPFSYEIEPNIYIKGNPAQLKQLTEILLDNAAKYASPGGETTLTLKSTSKKTCTIEVADQGEEIAADDLKNLFKRFYRADKARTMNHSYGLGLSIAQSICDDHSGKISVQSSDGWNRFTVTLSKEDSQQVIIKA